MAAVRDSRFLTPNFRRREVGQPSQVVHGPTKFWIFHLLVGLSPPREGPWLWGPSYRKSEERMSGHEVSGREQWMEARKIEEVKPPSGVGDREVRLEPVPSAPVPAAPRTPGQEERSCLHIKTRARLRKAMWPRVTLHWASVLALVTG